MGSNHYVENPVYPLKNTIACLNMDMIGRPDEFHPNDSNYVYLIGSDKLSKDLHNISEYSNNTYVNMDIDYTYNDPDDPNRFYYRSDHYNFAKRIFPQYSILAEFMKIITNIQIQQKNWSMKRLKKNRKANILYSLGAF